MESLHRDWITEKHIDFEYKKYVLLAYLQHVSEQFRINQLYPSLSDLIDHYKTTMSIKENKNQLASHFPQRLKGINGNKFRLEYEDVVKDDKMMNELESILDFSLTKFAVSLNEGKQIYDFIEKEILLQPIGILPIDSSAGYLFLKDQSSNTQVYCFSVTLFEKSDASWRGINTRYIRTYTKSVMHTFDAIKSKLIVENRGLPNPAVFAAESDLSIPIQQTFLPIAKRMLVKEVSKKMNPLEIKKGPSSKPRLG